MNPLKRIALKAIRRLGYVVVKADGCVSAPPLNISYSPDIRPADYFLAAAHQVFSDGHFHSHYVEWRTRRIKKVIDIAGVDYAGKRIVELGAGHGDIGAFFADLGAEVTSVEGRQAHCNFANLKYRNVPTFRSMQRDLDAPFGDLGKFDMAISFGSLEVIGDAAAYIADCCKLSDVVFCETGVIPSDGIEEVRGRYESLAGLTNDHTLTGGINPVSPAFIEREFERHGFACQRFFDADLNCGPHVYDWKAGDDLAGKTARRFWRFHRPTSPAQQ